MLKAIIVSSALLNLGLLLGRFSGFIRESVLAGSFGLTAEADVAVMLLTVPDFLLNIMVGGGLAAALVPEFTAKPHSARALLFQALLVFSITFVFLTSILVLNVEWLMTILAPGFSAHQVDSSVVPMQLVLWLLPLSVITAIFTSYLQANNKFGAAAMGTLIINTVIIVGLLLSSGSPNALAYLAGFVLLGGSIRLLTQAMVSKFCCGAPVISVTPWHVRRELVIRFIQVAGSGSVLLSFPVLLRAFASFEGEGAVAVISYATKLVELPLAITVTFLATVLFPRLSKAFQDGKEPFSILITWGVRVTLFMSLIALVSIFPVANALSSIVYGRGMMSEQDVSEVTDLLEIGLIYIPFMGLSAFCTAAFHAQKNTKTPLCINLGAMVLLLAQLFLVNDRTLTHLMQALVISYAFAGIVSVVILFRKLPETWQLCFNPEFLIVIILMPAILFGLLGLLPLLPDAGRSISDLAIAFLFACLFCIAGAITVPMIRHKIRKKFS